MSSCAVCRTFPTSFGITNESSFDGSSAVVLAMAMVGSVAVLVTTLVITDWPGVELLPGSVEPPPDEAQPATAMAMSGTASNRPDECLDMVVGPSLWTKDLHLML